MEAENKPSHRDRSLVANANKIRNLRQLLGWTQEIAAKNSGYTSRLIRKLESGNAVRPQSLREVLECYHQALNRPDWRIEDYILVDEASQSEEISSEDLKLVERIREWFVRTYVLRHRGHIQEYCDPDITFRHGSSPPQSGIETIERLVAAMLTAFDPIEIEFDRCFTHRGQVFVFFTAKMKHVGVFNGVEATNKWVEVRANSRISLKAGKVIDVEDHWDVFELSRQLSGDSRNWP